MRGLGTAGHCFRLGACRDLASSVTATGRLLIVDSRITPTTLPPPTHQGGVERQSGLAGRVTLPSPPATSTNRRVHERQRHWRRPCVCRAPRTIANGGGVAGCPGAHAPERLGSPTPSGHAMSGRWACSTVGGARQLRPTTCARGRYRCG